MCRPGSIDVSHVYMSLSGTLARCLRLQPDNPSWIIMHADLYCGMNTQLSYGYVTVHICTYTPLFTTPLFHLLYLLPLPFYTPPLCHPLYLPATPLLYPFPSITLISTTLCPSPFTPPSTTPPPLLPPSLSHPQPLYLPHCHSPILFTSLSLSPPFPFFDLTLYHSL